MPIQLDEPIALEVDVTVSLPPAVRVSPSKRTPSPDMRVALLLDTHARQTYMRRRSFSPPTMPTLPYKQRIHLPEVSHSMPTSPEMRGSRSMPEMRRARPSCHSFAPVASGSSPTVSPTRSPLKPAIKSAAPSPSTSPSNSDSQGKRRQSIVSPFLAACASVPTAAGGGPSGAGAGALGAKLLGGLSPSKSSLRKALQAAKAAIPAEQKAERRAQRAEVLEEFEEARAVRDWEACERLLSRGLEASPDDPHLLSLRSSIHVHLGDWPRAVADAQRLCDTQPRAARGFARKGSHLCQAQRFHDAAEALAHALSLDPTDEASHQRLYAAIDAIRRHRTYRLSPTKRDAPIERSTIVARSCHVDMENKRTSRHPATPPITVTRPAAPPPPRASAVEPQYSTIHVSWEPTRHDGGDEPFEYQVELSPVDPINDQVHEWHVAHRGIRRFEVRIGELLPETEYVFRVCATNVIGPSAWSDYSTAKTTKAPAGLRRQLADIPKAWYGLQAQLDEMATSIVGESGGARSTRTEGDGWPASEPSLNAAVVAGALTTLVVPLPRVPSGLGADARDKLWRETVDNLKRHMPAIKQCFRLYTLMGTFDEDPCDISLTQYRRAIAELQLDREPYNLAQIDDIFVRSNRTAEETRVLEMRKAGLKVDREAEAKAAEAKATNKRAERASAEVDGGRTDRLLQHEFVGALLRLGALRAATLETKALERQSLGKALDELVTHHLEPFSLTRDDQMAKLLANRNVRWVLDKWRDKMAHPFGVYATADDSDAVDERGRLRKGAQARMQLMNLKEMLTLFEDASILDDARCTVRAVTSFFVLVNMDDEIYETDVGPRGDAQDNAAELSLDEFQEIAARVCDAKLHDRDGTQPFEEALDTWLGLIFVPAITNAAKRRVASGVVKRRRVKKEASLFGKSDVQETGDECYVDSNTRFE